MRRRPGLRLFGRTPRKTTQPASADDPVANASRFRTNLQPAMHCLVSGQACRRRSMSRRAVDPLNPCSTLLCHILQVSAANAQANLSHGNLPIELHIDIFSLHGGLFRALDALSGGTERLFMADASTTPIPPSPTSCLDAASDPELGPLQKARQDSCAFGRRDIKPQLALHRFGEPTEYRLGPKHASVGVRYSCTRHALALAYTFRHESRNY